MSSHSLGSCLLAFVFEAAVPRNTLALDVSNQSLFVRVVHNYTRTHQHCCNELVIVKRLVGFLVFRIVG